MEPIFKHFFRVAFISLILAGIADLGALWVLHASQQLLPDLVVGARVLYLQGFLIPALAGFCYHMLPKLMGSFLRYRSLVGFHLLSVIFGVGGLVVLQVLKAFEIHPVPAMYLLIANALLVAGQIVFAFNLLSSFNYKGKN